MEDLYSEMVREIKTAAEKQEQSVAEEKTRLEEENVSLIEYINELENTHLGTCRGKEIPNLKRHQQRRKLKLLKTRAANALFFVRQFGLGLKGIVLDDESGKNYKLSFSNETSSQKRPRPEADPSQSESPVLDAETSGRTKSSFEQLSTEEKKKVEEILFLLDKFCVSDDFYHEVSMTDEGQCLPRSYLVKECRSSLNSYCHVMPTPGNSVGAQLSFKDTLTEQIHLKIKEGKLKDGEKVRVKISCDGARMTRLSTYQLLSFSLLEIGQSVMSAKGIHTIAVAKGPEIYNTLRDTFSEVFAEINNIQQEGVLVVNGTAVPIELFLGGDYKFLLLVMGLAQATSNYACLWCKIHKDESDSYCRTQAGVICRMQNAKCRMQLRYTRFDMTKPDDYYCKKPIARTLEELQQENKKRGEEYCSKEKPLLNIPLDHIIADELHLLLRVTDVLVRNLIWEVMEWDKEIKINSKGKEKGEHLDRLLQGINDCGVTFTLWEKKDADGKPSGIYDWTSLMGSEKKILLKKLGVKLPGLLKPETSLTVVKVWEGFRELYFDYINQWIPEQVEVFTTKAKAWINTFCSLRAKRLGYKRANVTPYMHVIPYHVPATMKAHGSIKHFTGQGVEKNNDVARMVVLRHSNNWDSPTDVLLTEHRLRELHERERKVRPYTKANSEYWGREIKEKRKKRRRISTETGSEREVTGVTGIEHMTVAQLKKELKGLKVKGYSGKSKNELLQILKKAMS